MSSPGTGRSFQEPPVRQSSPSSSPADGHCPLPVPVKAHRPSVLPVEAGCLLKVRQDSDYVGSVAACDKVKDMVVA